MTSSLPLAQAVFRSPHETVHEKQDLFRRKKRDRGRGKREERIIGREDLVVGGREREERCN